MSRHESNPPKADLWMHALERAQLGVWDWDLVTNECYYSLSWARMLGYELAELQSDSRLWLTLTHPDDRERALESGDRHIAGLSQGIETELRLRHKDGRWIWVLDRGGVVERDAEGRPLRVVGVQTDITRQKLTEYQLEQINDRFRLALAASGTGIWHHDFGTGLSYWDERTRQIFGLVQETDEVSSETWHRYLHPEDREEAERRHAAPVFSEGSSGLRYRIIRSDGEIRHVETLAKFAAGTGSSGQLVGTIRDVTDELRAKEALSLERERLRVTLRSIWDGVITTDEDNRISFVNHSAANLLGRPEAELIGLSLSELMPSVAHLFSGEAILLTGVDINTELGGRHVRCTASPMRSPNGSSLGTVYTLHDVTEQRKRQEELAFAARHDALTGLLNRKAFDELISARLTTAADDPFSILYIDLDHFKALNDVAGHAAGDHALKEIASRIARCIPSGADAARLGGDEFAVLMRAAQPDEAEKVADEILDSIRSAELGSEVGSRRIGACIGITFVSENSLAATEALARADDACYAAKISGRNRFACFEDGAATGTSGLTAARLANDTLNALEDGRLRLFGQQIHRLGRPWEQSRRIEVLARLIDCDGKTIAPAEFISAAERFGMAARLDGWIINTALSGFAHALQGKDGVTLAFNLSAQTLSDPHLWDVVDRMVSATGVCHSNLAFEITETAAITNFDAAEQFVHNARERGCGVWLDDFGVGLSSFDYLRRFPLDGIKINGSFIDNIAVSKFDRAIVSSINSIANTAGYDLVAEKIETVEALNVLQELEVSSGQGYLLHRPEPLEEVMRKAGYATSGDSAAARKICSQRCTR